MNCSATSCNSVIPRPAPTARLEVTMARRRAISQATSSVATVAARGVGYHTMLVRATGDDSKKGSACWVRLGHQSPCALLTSGDPCCPRRSAAPFPTVIAKGTG